MPSHSGHVHQCGCEICLARCEGAEWERLRIRQLIAKRAISGPAAYQTELLHIVDLLDEAQGLWRG